MYTAIYVLFVLLLVVVVVVVVLVVHLIMQTKKRLVFSISLRPSTNNNKPFVCVRCVRSFFRDFSLCY